MIWTEASTLPAGYYADIAYGNGMFVALEDASMVSSPDGLVWTPHAAPEGTSGYSFGKIIFAGGIFMASCADSIATSPDGVTWTLAFNGKLGGDSWMSPTSLCSNGTRFVVWDRAGGIYGGNYYSADGTVWTPGTHDLPDTGVIYVCVGQPGGGFLGISGDGLVQRSADGIAFSSTGTTSVFPAGSGSSDARISFVDGQFTFTTLSNPSPGSGQVSFRRTVDGTTWNNIAANLVDSGYSAPSNFITVGGAPLCCNIDIDGGGTEGSLTTSDWVTFTTDRIPPDTLSFGYIALAASDNVVVALSNDGHTAISTLAPATTLFWEKRKTTKEFP